MPLHILLLLVIVAVVVQVFLLTNSLWDYTHVVMNFLCGKTTKAERTTEWLDLFDVAITGACKVTIIEYYGIMVLWYF